MSADATTVNDAGTIEPETTLADIFTETTTKWFSEGELTSTQTPIEEFLSTEITTVNEQTPLSENQETLFEAFIVLEIVMTALELILSLLAASKVARWRKNFRNQMLMQFSLVRLLKRVYSLIEFLEHNKKISGIVLSVVLKATQFYIDFVIVILVCFFIKHMYDSLIVVVCKINRNQLMKVTLCSWLVPLPVSIIGSGLVHFQVVQHKVAYVFICGVFKWPLMLIGTVVYLTILFKVMSDKIRHFARSLTIITFLLCLVLNVHLFCRDAIWLLCIESFTTNIASYILGFIANVLVLCLYIVLITLNLKCNKSKSCDNVFYSENFTRC